MHSETKRQEYVLSQHGQIYTGTYKRIKAIPWNYGQVTSNIHFLFIFKCNENIMDTNLFKLLVSSAV